MYDRYLRHRYILEFASRSLFVALYQSWLFVMFYPRPVPRMHINFNQVAFTQIPSGHKFNSRAYVGKDQPELRYLSRPKLSVDT